MAEVRSYLSELSNCSAMDCTTYKYSIADKKLISKTGFCSTCLAKREAEIKIDGLWEEYQTYKIYSNMLAEGTDIVAKLNQAHSDAKQEYEYMNDNGIKETWKMERPVEELKADILNDIISVESEISEIQKVRDDAWSKLKDKNYLLLASN